MNPQIPQELPKLRLLCDIVFRRLFDEPSLLISLLNAVLHLCGDRRITSLTITPCQLTGPLAEDKEIILDIRAQCQNGRQFHVEVQVRAFIAYPKRMLFYWASPFHGQLEAGQGYRDLKPVISLHILGFHLLPRKKRFRHFHHLFEVRDRRTHYRLSRHLQIHTVEMPKLKRALEELATDEVRWLYFLRNGHRMTAEQVAQLGMPEILRAEEKLRVISQDRTLRVRYEQRMKAQRDAIAWEKDHISQWLEDGERIGLEKGKRLGLDEGKRLGLDEGKRALRAAILDMCELLDLELSPEQRAELEALDLAGLEQLRLSLKHDRRWPQP